MKSLGYILKRHAHIFLLIVAILFWIWTRMFYFSSLIREKLYGYTYL
ncbi:MAG: hypothetical protein J7L07_10670 [Candidatus Odinarchaeota archaeon]|nr:hypothetical protein [Candidatus Odinarchaeota archaeon]